MLNEQKEYREYLTLPEDASVKCRLNPTLFVKKTCGGIRRPLTILARHCLFDVFDYTNAENKKEIREKTLHLLSRWCFDEACDFRVSAKIPKGWLRKYCELYNAYPFAAPKKPKKKVDTEPEKQEDREPEPSLPQDTALENIAEAPAVDLWKLFCQNRKGAWENDNLYSTFLYHSPSANAFNFRMILADAIQAGPLKEYVLICKKEYASELLYKTAKTSYHQPEPEVCDRILKQIAAYLLELKSQNRTGGYADINLTDLANWMQYPSFAAESHPCSYLYKGDELFLRKDSMTFIDPHFLKDYDFRLVELSDLAQQKKDLPKKVYVYYRDNGSGKRSLKEYPI